MAHYHRLSLSLAGPLEAAVRESTEGDDASDCQTGR